MVLGAVSFLHRFGSALNPHPHFHLAVTDGLFAREHDEEAAPLRFRPAADLNPERARAPTPIMQRRILRLYVRRGLLLEADAADMLTWRGTDGFILDGSVRIAAHDRAGLERLLRYCARPPFAVHRPRPEPSKRSLSSPDATVFRQLVQAHNDVAFVDHQRAERLGSTSATVVLNDFAAFLHRNPGVRREWLAREDELIAFRRQLLPHSEDASFWRDLIVEDLKTLDTLHQ